MLFQCLLVALLVAQGYALDARITNGENAVPHKYPYQVSIQWGFPPLIKYRHVCGGSILNENWILTAGHCITELPKVGHFEVRAGKHYINRDEIGEQKRKVKLQIYHDNYPGGVAQHDIGLLRLESPLVFNKNIQPVALPKANKQHTGNVILTGWGSTSTSWLPNLPTELQVADLPIVDYDTCYESFHSVSSDVELFDTQICTGPVGGDLSACSGDSGGPIVQNNKKGEPEVVGVVSWGNYPCGSAGTPSVYTRVSSYVDWINAKLI